MRYFKDLIPQYIYIYMKVSAAAGLPPGRAALPVTLAIAGRYRGPLSTSAFHLRSAFLVQESTAFAFKVCPGVPLHLQALPCLFAPLLDRSLPIRVGTLISGIWLQQYMFPLVFLVLIFFAQYFTICETEIEKEENAGKTFLASSSPRDSQAVVRAAQFDLRDIAEPSFERSQSSCQAPKRDGEVRSLEMLLLHETCQGQVGSVRRMLAILGAMPRFQLCPPTEVISLYRWMVRSRMVGRWTMGHKSTQIAQKTHTEPTKENQAAQCGGRQRQVQGRRKRLSRTSFHAMAVATYIAGFHASCRSASCTSYFIGSISCNTIDAAISEAWRPCAWSSQRRTGIVCISASLQGDQKQAQPSGRHQEGCASYRSVCAQGGCQVTQSTCLPIEQHQKETDGDRRPMGCIQGSMGCLFGQGHPNVDGACRGVRARGVVLCRKTERSAPQLAQHQRCVAGCPSTHYGSRCFGIQRHRHGARSSRCLYEHRGGGWLRCSEQLCADQREPHRCGATSQKHHRRQDQEARKSSWWKCRSTRCGDCGACRQEVSGFRSALTLRVSQDEAFSGCLTPERREEGRKRDRFCKVSFWPIVDFEGESDEMVPRCCNFWSEADDLEMARLSTPFPYFHSVMEEADFRSVWDARDAALILAESIHSTAFDVDFDVVYKRWRARATCWWDDVNVTPTIEEPLPFMTFHTTDAWHDVPSNWQGTHGPQEHPDHELDDAPHFLHEAPETIRHLYDEFLYQGLIDGPRLSEAIHVRSWYLHHLRQRHWDTPRVLELDGHWRHWARDIAGGWRDQINVDEDIAFYICRPDPPRNVAIAHEIFFDLIVAQGIDVNEWAGLITVIRTDDLAARAEFSRAVSLPQFVSGERLAMLVGRTQQCHLRGCRIAHARTEIPFTHEPVHEMTNGDAFIIHPRRSQAAAAPILAAQGEELADLDYDTCGDQHPEHAPDEDAVVSEGYSPSSEAPNDMQGTHIYRLGQIAIFGHLDWRSYHAALRDAAQLLRMSINQFVGFHYAQVHLPGHDAGDEAIIMQHVNDIQPGSLEKLVIVDIVYHTNRLVHGVPDNPTVTREVYKLPPQIVRQHLLIFAQVASYCTWRSDQCVVHHNDREWYRTDQRLRDISHGAVFQIQLPPPPRAEWQIGQAVRVAHETGELFDFPAAGDLAYAIMNGQIDANRQDYDGTSTTGARVVQCKGSDHVEDIDIPITFPPGVQVPRLRPRHDGVFTWLYDLAEIFRQDAEAEVFDGDPLLYVQTWYVHHQRYKRCHRPRAVRLDGAMIGWIEEFRQTWNDILDHNIPFGLHVVRPRPPRPRLQSFSCHVIVEQAPVPHRAAGVISVLLEGPERDALQQFAGSLPQLINRPLVIEELGLQPQCDLRRCSVQANGEPVHLILMTALPGGFNVCVRVESVDAQRPIPPSEEDAHFEDLVLMQLPPDAAIASGPQQPAPVHAAPCNGFAFNPAAQPFVPGNVQLNAMSEFVQELYELWETVAFAWEDEPRSSLFTTWFVDHAGDFRHCTTPRNVELSEDFTTWELTLRQRWHDFLRDDSPLEYYIVQPNPPRQQPNIAGHIILVYHEHEVMVTSLVTLIDHTLRENHGRFQQMAVTTHEQIYLADLLEVVGYAQICLPPDSPRVCRAWYMDERFRDGRPLMGRSGYGININVQRRVYPGDAAAFLQRPPRHQDEGVIRERQTQGQVAHTPGPRLPLHSCMVPPKPLALAELLPTAELMTEPATNLEHEIVRDAVVKLRSGSSDLVVPSFLEVPCTHDESWIAHILLEWGINCKTYRFGGHDEYLCLPSDWSTTEQHVIYGTQDGIEDGAAILHTWNAADGPLNVLGHMKVLYKMGYIKTAIIEVVDLRPGLCRVVFAHLQPKLAAPALAQKLPSEWPLPQPIGRDEFPPFDPASWQAECSDCCLAFGISLEELQEVFVPDSFPLCTTLDGLDLPLTTRQFVEDLQQNPDLPLSHFDRIVVYADGSSLSALRHQPPLLLAEKGQADTWAFIVIGEVQASDGTFQRYLIGWQAQPVLYEEQNRAFIGATHAGSDAAEREALFWSMMWRISINDSVSTTFCTDSQLTQAQASGVVGSHQSTESFQMLRGAAQTLAAILPHDKLRIQHVKGHSNDPLNDFVDFAAKAEREKSFYLPRPKFSLCKLRKFIPYPTCGCSFTNKQDFLDFVEMAFTPHLRRCLRLTGRVMKLEMSSHNGDSSRFARVLLRPMFSRSIEGTMVMQEKSNTCDRNLFSID